MIKIKNITKSFTQEKNKNFVYKNLSLEVNSGDFIAIIWKSGCGKSTLLNLLSGLVDVDCGSILIDNKEITQFSQDEMTKFRGKNMSFVFQQFHLIPNLTVEENIELVCEMNGTESQFTVDELLEKVWLLEKKESYPYELSWGQQQRVAIARGFIAKTPLMLADEPTGNLDENNAKNIMEILTNLHKETKNTILLITHDHDIANYANKVYELQENNLVLQK